MFEEEVEYESSDDDDCGQSGSLKVYFSKWVSYIVDLSPVVTCF